MSVPHVPGPSPAPRKRVSAWKVVLVVLLTLVLGLLVTGLVLLAYTGLVPGLSGLVGADKPRDLGVHATQADYDRAVEHVSTLIKKTPAAGGGAPQRIDYEFTDVELTALLAHAASSDMPIENPQVRIHADGLIEIAVGLAKSGLPPEVLEQLPGAGMLPEKLPLYARTRLTIAGPNELQLDAQRLEVGRMPMPLSLLGPNGGLSLSDAINEQLRSSPGLVIENLTYQDGKVRVQATYQP